MEEFPIDEFHNTAIIERISSHTVGIAVRDNRGVGTGTLVSFRGRRYILTASHVVRGVDPTKIRFWCKPSHPVIEKSAADVTDEEIGSGTLGEPFPIKYVQRSLQLDTAILEVEPTFQPSGGGAFYELSASKGILDWPEADLEGCSIFVFGFPRENSRPVRVIGNRIEKFLGFSGFYSRYRSEAATQHASLLTGNLSPATHFLFDYVPPIPNMLALGFSGAGVWILQGDRNQTLWSVKPILIGQAHKYFPTESMIGATKLPYIFARLSQNEVETADAT